MTADEQDALISEATRETIALAARLNGLVAMFASSRPRGTQLDAPAKAIDWWQINGVVNAFDDVRPMLLEAARIGIRIREAGLVAGTPAQKRELRRKSSRRR